MATVSRLTDQRAAGFHFSEERGMGQSKKLEKLTAEDLAAAARNLPDAAGLEYSIHDDAVPQSVRDILHATHNASATAGGTNSHRELCRHEGVAYTETFGLPLIFMTPNPANTQPPLLLVVQDGGHGRGDCGHGAGPAEVLSSASAPCGGSGWADCSVRTCHALAILFLSSCTS